jgi:hypothetical protein
MFEFLGLEFNPTNTNTKNQQTEYWVSLRISLFKISYFVEFGGKVDV